VRIWRSVFTPSSRLFFRSNFFMFMYSRMASNTGGERRGMAWHVVEGEKCRDAQCSPPKRGRGGRDQQREQISEQVTGAAGAAMRATNWWRDEGKPVLAVDICCCFSLLFFHPAGKSPGPFDLNRYLEYLPQVTASRMIKKLIDLEKRSLFYFLGRSPLTALSAMQHSTWDFFGTKTLCQKHKTDSIYNSNNGIKKTSLPRILVIIFWIPVMKEGYKHYPSPPSLLLAAFSMKEGYKLPSSSSPGWLGRSLWKNWALTLLNCCFS
jgi:hypothetical protein